MDLIIIFLKNFCFKLNLKKIFLFSCSYYGNDMAMVFILLQLLSMPCYFVYDCMLDHGLWISLSRKSYRNLFYVSIIIFLMKTILVYYGSENRLSIQLTETIFISFMEQYLYFDCIISFDSVVSFLWAYGHSWYYCRKICFLFRMKY